MMPGEILAQQLSCRGDRVRVYCSAHNPGCRKVAEHVARQIDGIRVVTARPWQDGEDSQHGAAGALSPLSRSRSRSRSGSTPRRLLRAASGSFSHRSHSNNVARRHRFSQSGGGGFGGVSQDELCEDDSRLAMMLYLNDQTFVGTMGDALAAEVREARANDVGIVLMHENDVSRGGGPFARLFTTTPKDLIDDGLYSDLALALYDGPHRAIGYAMVGQALGAKPTVKARLMPWYASFGQKLHRSGSISEGTMAEALARRSPSSASSLGGDHSNNNPHLNPPGASLQPHQPARRRSVMPTPWGRGLMKLGGWGGIANESVSPPV